MPEFRNIWEITLTVVGVLDLVIILVTIPWILAIKKKSMSAVAWCLVVILIPIIGFVLFVWFGYNYVHRPLRRKRRHRAGFRIRNPATRREPAAGEWPDEDSPDGTWRGLGRLAVKLGAFPVSDGNQVVFYHDTQKAFDAMFEAIQAARHHIHLEYFIVQADTTGRRFLDLLTRKAKEGVKVRLIYDAIGSFYLKRRLLRPLARAGGEYAAFLTLNLWRRRFQINMRNHRKITIVDGRVAFTGGINIGDEYLGRDATLGYWRDLMMRLEGPAVAALQRVFVEDWDFAQEEHLQGEEYFPELPAAGEAVVQVVESGPDQEVNSFRELVFAAITMARERLWLATPYFVPDEGLLDALRLAARLGVDIRILVPKRPDHWLPHFAGSYYLGGLLAEGVRVYQYTRGMMHSKMMMVDGKWGWAGTGNFDNRSLHLNFEVNCVLHSPELIASLEAAFTKDLSSSSRVEIKTYAQRPFSTRLAENASRLFSPVL
jgi:cardiolipin synthase